MIICDTKNYSISKKIWCEVSGFKAFIGGCAISSCASFALWNCATEHSSPVSLTAFSPFWRWNLHKRETETQKGLHQLKQKKWEKKPCAASSGLAKDCGASGAHHNCLGVAEHSGDPVEENCHLTKHNSDPWEKDNTLWTTLNHNKY